MSYQVLARKWRPRTFDEVVGQEHVARALANALDQGRLHHAFLFSGTRGIGKTTLARILAKCLNCDAGPSSQPCGACGACADIDAGRFVDLIEVDAASRTGVDDTRELLENVQYMPTAGRYKVYLIDEVHMLSTHSFNALLKTLEEPPPHVKFLLATTDPDKLPATVVSRCLQFNLRPLPPGRIAAKLEAILTDEGVTYDKEAVNLIARAADGSLRDGLSLLDQAVVFGAGHLGEPDVRAMLGSIERHQVADILRAVAAGDGQAAMEATDALADRAGDFGQALRDMAALLQRVAVGQVVPEALGEDESDRDTMRELAGSIAPEDVQLLYQITLMGGRDLPLAPDPRTGFEMVVLRMLAFRPLEAGGVSPDTVPSRGADKPASRSRARPAPAGTGAAGRGTTGGGEPAGGSAGAAVAGPPADTDGHLDWPRVVAGLTGMANQLASHCVVADYDGRVIRLTLNPSHASLMGTTAEQRLGDALRGILGESVRVSVEVGESDVETPAKQRERRRSERQQDAQANIEADPTVQALQETFDARIDPRSVRPDGDGD